MARPRRQSELPGAAQVYERLLAEQGGRCAIEGCRVRAVTRRYHQDHDHKTGAARGLLCFRHNKLMLQSWVNAESLRACADYLDRWAA